MKYITAINLFDGEGFKGFGKLGLDTVDPAEKVFSQFISSTIGLITVIAIIWFIFTFITGAIGFISSGGDKAAIESSKKKIMNALIGLVVVILGIFIIRLIGVLIGIPDILNFGEMFGNLLLI